MPLGGHETLESGQISQSKNFPHSDRWPDYRGPIHPRQGDHLSQDGLPFQKDDKNTQRRTKMKPSTQAEEKEILEALESGAIQLEKPSRKLLADLKKASENTFKKDRRINVRLSSHDLLGIQRKALQKGLPYQALISGLIHQYVEGDLIEK
jgi:predicted DNA binding CopG/RHH family protein